MVGRGELTDTAWTTIEPLLPRSQARGGQWRDHHTVINGIQWKLRTGAPWRDLPERCGPWQTCADRLYRWRRDGTWDRLLVHIQTRLDAVGEVHWEVSIDSTPPVPISMPVAPAVGRVGPTRKGGLSPARRGARAQPGWADNQVPSGLRRQGTTTLDRDYAGTAP